MRPRLTFGPTSRRLTSPPAKACAAQDSRIPQRSSSRGLEPNAERPFCEIFFGSTSSDSGRAGRRLEAEPTAGIMRQGGSEFSSQVVTVVTMMRAAISSMLATGGGIPRGQIGVVLAAGLAGGAIFLLILIRRPIRHTTLRHAWGWAAAALASLGIVEVWFQLQPAGNMSIWLPAVRYLAGAL